MFDERLGSSASHGGSQSRFWRELVVVGLVLAAVLAAVELTLSGPWLRGVARDLVFDIQSPHSVFAKIDVLRRESEFKVAVLGDSLVVGLTMKEHGDERWREHTIPTELERSLRQWMPDRKITVMNLGLNGALPSDLASLAESLRAAKPDLVLCDLGLRSFSNDFNSPKKEHSREWIARIAVDSEGHCRETIRAGTRPDPVESWAVSLGVNHSRLFADREILQHELFGNSPRGVCDTVRDRLCDLTRTGAAPTGDPDIAQAMLTMKVKRRCESIHFAPNHLQRRGLEELLKTAQTESWKLLLFYAQEDPEHVGEVFEKSQYQEAREALRAVIAPFLSGDIRYFKDPIQHSPASYLDLVHLNYDGCRTLVGALEPDLRRLLRLGATADSAKSD